MTVLGKLEEATLNSCAILISSYLNGWQVMAIKMYDTVNQKNAFFLSYLFLLILLHFTVNLCFFLSTTSPIDCMTLM